MDDHPQPALVAIVGKSDSGKTTLIERLVPQLVKLRPARANGQARRPQLRDRPPRQGLLAARPGRGTRVRHRLARATRVHRQARQANCRWPTSWRRTSAGSTSSSPRVTSTARRTASRCSRHGAGHQTPLCGPGESLALVTDASAPARAPLRPRGRRRAGSLPSRPPGTHCARYWGGGARGRVVRATPPLPRGPRRTLDTARRRVESSARDAGGLIRIADNARPATRPTQEQQSQPSEQRRSGVWRRT